MIVYLIVAKSLGIMRSWNMKPISIYSDRHAAEAEVARLNRLDNDGYSIMEMELRTGGQTDEKVL